MPPASNRLLAKLARAVKSEARPRQARRTLGRSPCARDRRRCGRAGARKARRAECAEAARSAASPEHRPWRSDSARTATGSSARSGKSLAPIERVLPRRDIFLALGADALPRRVWIDPVSKRRDDAAGALRSSERATMPPRKADRSGLRWRPSPQPHRRHGAGSTPRSESSACCGRCGGQARRGGRARRIGQHADGVGAADRRGKCGDGAAHDVPLRDRAWSACARRSRR